MTSAPLDQLLARCRWTAELLQPAFERGKVRHDQRRDIPLPIAEHDRFGDQRAAVEDVLDRLRRDLLAA